MADTNLRILVSVEGGQTATAQLKGVAGATGQVGTQTEQAGKKSSALGQTLRGLATGFAVYKGAQFIRSAVNETVSLAKATAGLSRTTGMDTRTASGWVGVAKERGISAKQLNMGFITLSRQMQSAAGGSKTTAKAFAALGISQDQVRHSNPQQVLGHISDAFAKMPDGAQKAALAQKLFGRTSQGLLPLINKGSGALNEQISAMAKHIGMSKADMERSLEMARQQRELNATMLGFKVAVGSALLPILTQIAKAVVPVIAGFAQLMQGSKVFRIAVIGLTAAVIALNVAMSLNPWVLIAAGVAVVIAALVLAYTKVSWFRDAVNAVWNAIKTAAVFAFNFIRDHWQLLLAIMWPGFGLLVGFAISHFGQIKAVVQAVFGAIKATFSTVVGAARNAFGATKSVAVSIFNGIRNAIGGAINGIKTAINGVKSVASSVFGAIRTVVNHVAQFVTTYVVGAFNAVKSAVEAVLGPVNTLANAVGKVAHGMASLPGKALHAIGLQEGGYVSHGTIALVGEAGPEIVALPGGSTVIPNHALGGLAGAGGGVVHTHVYLEGREIAHAMGNYVAGQQAAR